MSREERPLAGIVANTIAFGAIACGDAMSKLAVAVLPIPQTLALRAAIVFVLLTPLFLHARRAQGKIFATRRPWLHLVRVVVQLGSVVTFLSALKHLPLTTNVAIALVTPIIVALWAIILLKEHVRPHQAIAIVIGLAGCLVILRPGYGDFSFWMLVSLASSVMWALALVLMRMLAPTESNITIMAWQNLAFVLVMSAWALIDPRPFDWSLSWLIFGMALTQVVGQWFGAQAFRLARAATVAPAQYSQMIWSIILGYLIWSETPAPHVLIGVALVIAGGVWLVRGERQT